MKLNGQSFPPQEVLEVKLPRGDASIPVKVCGFPLGVNQQYAILWPKPIPPVTVTHRAGKPDETSPNFDDAAWQKDIAQWRYYNNIYIVYRGLVGGGTVSFDVTPTSKETIIAIADEMRAAGISEGDVSLILKGIEAASHINDAMIQAEKKTF